MASFNKFNAFVEHLAEGVHNLQSNTLKAMLTNTAPSAANTVKADITEIANGNGYTTGGVTLSVTSSAQSAGTYKLVIADQSPAWTASGGSIGPARYVVIYNDTPASPADPLIGWYDYGSSFTLNAGESLTLDFDGTNGMLTIA